MKKSLQFSGSLRLRIVKSFLLALLPVALFAFVTVEMFLVSSIEQNARSELANSTRVLTNAIRTAASVAIRNHLRAIAERNLDIATHYYSLAENGSFSIEEATARLEQIFLSQHVGSSGYLYCLNSEGTVVVHPNARLRGESVAEFPFIQEQIQEKEGYIEYDWKNPGELEARPKGLYMVYFEPFDWIISASSYRSEFNEMLNPDDFRETLLSLRFGKSGYAYMINTEGDVLVHPKHQNFNILQQQEFPSSFVQEMLEEKAGSLEYVWRNPDEEKPRRKIAVYESIPEYDWIVVSSSYVEEIMRPVQVTRAISYGSILLLLFMATITSYWLSGKVTRPVDKMMGQLDINAREGLHAPLPVSGDDEIGRLASEFNNYLETVDFQREELRQQRERYRNLFEASPDAIFLIRNFEIIECNPAMYHVFDADKESLRGKTVVELSPAVQPDGQNSAAKAARMMKEAAATGFLAFEWKHQTLHGKNFDSEVRIKPFTGYGEEGLFLAIIRDITERKMAEDALKESELKYRELIESANDAIFIAQDGKIVFTNSKTALISGYSDEELLTMPFTAFIHPEDLEMVAERHQRRLSGDSDIPATYSFRLISKARQEFIVQISAVVIEWDGRPATLNFLRDVTELKKMEDVLQSAQKMEAIGTLAGGIAHDFNNLLMGIQGHTALLEASGRNETELLEHIQAINEYIGSATGLTRQLLGFARGGKYSVSPLDLCVLVEESLAMFGRTRKELKISVQTPGSAVVVELDKAQMEQVLLNMYVNAWQAMPGGGEIHVEVREMELDELFCEPYEARAGRYAQLSVADTGTGIDAAISKKIFDPFFTTKDKMRGTGLGLASAYGIVRNHGGFITLESENGGGATFSIYLPLSDKEVASAVTTERAIIQGSGRVLLVDDEDMILEVGTAMLSQLGFEPIPAKGGRRALELLKSMNKSPDLVILDLVMPEMDGSTTFDGIRELYNSVPILLSSGYAVDGVAKQVLRRGCSAFIQKPFSLVELSQKIAEILNNRDSNHPAA